MARVVAFVPDLLFGSNVLGGLSAAGHDAVLVSDRAGLERELPGSRAVVIDLTADAEERIRQLEGVPRDGVKTLAFYSHVEVDVRAQAEQAGFDLVIPRSRMAREGARLADPACSRPTRAPARPAACTGAERRVELVGLTDPGRRDRVHDLRDGARIDRADRARLARRAHPER